jgi:hypothetical protein
VKVSNRREELYSRRKGTTEGRKKERKKELEIKGGQAMRYAQAQLYRRDQHWGEQNDCGMIGSEGCLLPVAAERDKECDWEAGLEVTGHWRQMYWQFLCK